MMTVILILAVLGLAVSVACYVARCRRYAALEAKLIASRNDGTAWTLRYMDEHNRRTAAEREAADLKLSVQIAEAAYAELFSMTERQKAAKPKRSHKKGASCRSKS